MRTSVKSRDQVDGRNTAPTQPRSREGGATSGARTDAASGSAGLAGLARAAPEPASRRDRAGKLRNPGSRQTPSAPAQSAREDSESLFVPENDEAGRSQEDEDETWAPMDYEREETLGWDASADPNASVYPTFRDSGNTSSTNNTAKSSEVIEPTQRVSQVKGLW